MRTRKSTTSSQDSFQHSSRSSTKSAHKPRSEIKAKKADEIDQARKKAQIRDRLPRQDNILLQEEGKFVLRNWVFVGNLLPNTTEAWLKELFSAFGKITRVLMRCSGGRVHTPRPLREPARRDHHYASIEFDSRAASRRALSANGKAVRDAADRTEQKLVVSMFPGDLPEATDLLSVRLDDIMCKISGPTGAQLFLQGRLPVRRQRTELFEYPDQARAQNNRNILRRLSFGKTIV